MEYIQRNYRIKVEHDKAVKKASAKMRKEVKKVNPNATSEEYSESQVVRRLLDNLN